jgi:hypothetical protein
MTPLTLDDLRGMARAQGLDLSDADLAGLLPLVQAGREILTGLDPVLGPETEPTALYHVARAEGGR